MCANLADRWGAVYTNVWHVKYKLNYYDRYIKQDFEKPTIGILLCEEKNDALVELTLPKDANIYASAYQLYLPDKALLQRNLKEWIDEFEDHSSSVDGF